MSNLVCGRQINRWEANLAGLQLKNVTKNFGSVNVIKGIDLDIPHGEFVVFVGGSLGRPSGFYVSDNSISIMSFSKYCSWVDYSYIPIKGTLTVEFE